MHPNEFLHLILGGLGDFHGVIQILPGFLTMTGRGNRLRQLKEQIVQFGPKLVQIFLCAQLNLVLLGCSHSLEVHILVCRT